MSRQSCGGEQVAAAQHGPGAGVLLHLAKELPRTGPFVPLADGAAVDRNGHHAAGEGAVEDGEEIVAALCGVVHAAAELDGERQCGGRASRTRATISRAVVRLAQQIAAAAAAQDLLHRAGEVQVDHVEAGCRQPDGRQRRTARAASPINCAPQG